MSERFTQRGGRLEEINHTDPLLREFMSRHYSKPRGFVGRRIIYRVVAAGQVWGFTVAGSTTLHCRPAKKLLVFRDRLLKRIPNNTFFRLERGERKYPWRNFVPSVIDAWERHVFARWREKYGDEVLAYETLVAPPRTGECYLRCGWRFLGWTQGWEAKRTRRTETRDSYGGTRVWRRGPRKRVFGKLASG